MIVTNKIISKNLLLILFLISILFCFNSCSDSEIIDNTVSPFSHQLFVVDSDDIMTDGKYIYPEVNDELSIANRKCEILDVNNIGDIESQISPANYKYYAIPRRENQPFERWADSCRVEAIKDVATPFFYATFISDGHFARGKFIGDYTPSEYKPAELLERLNRDAYKERNHTSLQINNVDVAYFCEGTAANVTVSFVPVTDTLVCNFVYQVEVRLYNYKDNPIYGYQRAYIVPGQEKYEFNICPENFIESNKILDVALVGVTEGDSLKITTTDVELGYSLSKWLDYAFGEYDKECFFADRYDHRSSFWQKIFFNYDLSVSWWRLLLYITVAILSFILMSICSSERFENLILVTGYVIVAVAIIFVVLWFVLGLIYELHFFNF